MTRLYNWHRTPDRVAVYEPRYSRRGLLESEDIILQARHSSVDGEHSYNGGKRTTAIRALSYDEKGQRQHIIYGNGAITRYDYDPETFRLKQLRTTRPDYDPAFPGHRSNLRDDRVLQQLSYTYDPVGNITEIYDEAFEPVYFRNQRVEPRSRYRYDALYRLVEATGRENVGLTGAPSQSEAPPELREFPITDSALRNYTQSYDYDAVGNMDRMRHSAGAGSWTRAYAYASDSNRLLQTQVGDNDEITEYHYDRHGSMLNLARVTEDQRLRWDHTDMLQQVNLGGGGTAHYRYDTAKQRTRKVIRNRDGSIRWERLYLGGAELYRRYKNGRAVETIESHHLFVGESRVLLVDDVLETEDAAGPATLFRYQLGDHLGSATMELDENAQVISFEEYHPYGTSAYRAANSTVRHAAKRYRYTGMERDEETGLSYHTARHYLPWLARWASADPLGIAGGSNNYSYAANNPIAKVDLDGKQAMMLSDPEGIVQQLPNADEETTSRNADRLRQHARDIRSRAPTEELQTAATFRNCPSCHDAPRPARVIMPGDAADLGTPVIMAVGEVAISMIPTVGELQDIDVILNPQSGPWEIGLASVSLGVSLFTAGLSPNAGAAVRAADPLEEALSGAARQSDELAQGLRSLPEENWSRVLDDTPADDFGFANRILQTEEGNLGAIIHRLPVENTARSGTDWMPMNCFRAYMSAKLWGLIGPLRY